MRFNIGPPVSRVPGRRLIQGTATAAVATLALTTALTLSGPVRQAEAATGEARYHFVDCGAPVDGAGTIGEPWNSLDSVAVHVFEPGDSLLFHRGATCHGALTTQGSGTREAPVVVDAYGPLEAGYPVIAGGGVRDAVLLENQEYWHIRNLEITNTDQAGRYTAARRGVTVLNVDQGKLSGIQLEGLYIHDVYGEGKKDLGGSGAIQLEVDTRDGVTRSWFDDTVVSGNRIEDVNRSGINMSTAWKCRAEMAWDTPCDPRQPGARPFTPSTGLVIRNNTLARVGGDGIVVQMNDGAIVESNHLSDGSSRSNAENAGIWVWNSDNTLFQYNVVTNSQKINQNDGTAWDADYGSRNTVFQYNLSYDNAGGGMFFCGCGNWKIEGLGFATDVVYRYNLSVGDGQAAELADIAGNSNANRFQFLAGVTDSSSYNNTIILPGALPPVSGGTGHSLNGANDTGNSLLLANNLFVTTGEIAPETYDSTANVITWLNNAFSGPAAHWPAGTGDVRIAEPLLTSVTGTDAVEKFLSRSPQLAAAGQPVAPIGTYDIQGTEVLEGCTPDIGAFQFTDQTAQQCSTVLRDREVSADGSLVVPVRANATLRVSGHVAPGGTLTVTNDAGLVHVATADPGASTVSTVVRTSTDAGAQLTITCSAGACTDVNVTGASDDMIDGSFESLKNSPWYLAPWTSWVSPWSGTPQQRARQAAELRTRDVTAAGALAARITATEPRLAQDNLPVRAGGDYRITAWALPGATSSPVTFTLRAFVDNVVVGDPLKVFTVDGSATQMVHLDERFVMPAGVSAVSLEISQDGLAGSQQAIIDNVALTRADTAPTVIREPADVTATEGQLAAFLAGFSGDDDPQVEWQRLDGERWQPATATKLGQQGQVERTSRLVVDQVGLADTGARFRAVATNVSGNVTTQEVTLTVVPQGASPVVSVDAPRTAVRGTGATASATAAAHPGATWGWQQEAADGRWHDVESATGTTIDLDNLGQAGEIVRLRAVASSAFGVGISEAVDILLLAAPSLTVTPAEVAPGQTITVRGEGARPLEQVAVELRSEPQLLVTLSADTAGSFSGTATVPTTIEGSSEHSVAAVGEVSGEIASAALVVTPKVGQETDAGPAESDPDGSGAAPGTPGATEGPTEGSASAGGGALATTGADLAVVLAIALAFVLAGVGLRRARGRVDRQS